MVCSLLLLLIGLCFGAWRTGVRAFSKADRKTKLLTDLQVVAVMLRREASFASRPSFTLENDTDGSALSFLSARTLKASGDRFTVDPGSFRPEWQKYLLVWLDKGSGELFQREVPLVAGAAQRRYPTPIELYDAGPGVQPLADYLEDGRKLVAGVDSLLARWEENALRVTLGGRGTDRTAVEEERFTYEVVLQPRN